jgi:homoserine kinase type II
LFTGNRVTGVVDYGAIKIDHVAVDLARLLGSLIEDDAALRRRGLEAYQRVRPLSAEEEALVILLDETGTLLGAANWLKWLYVDRKSFEKREAVTERLARLVRRIEQWK